MEVPNYNVKIWRYLVAAEDIKKPDLMRRKLVSSKI